MSASVTPITDHPRFKQEREAPLGKAAFANAVGYSVRWVELRMKDGLPYTRLPNGYARFLLSECEPWIASWLEGRTP